MPKYFITIVLILLLSGARSQESWQQMMQHRDSLLRQIDTVPAAFILKKPAELRRDNQQLRNLVFFDSLLLQKIINTLPPDTLIPGLIAQRSLLVHQRLDLQQRLDNSEKQLFIAGRYLNMLLIVSFILVVVALVVIVILMRHRSKVKRLEASNSKFYTDLHALQSEIEKHQETQKQLATAINKSKTQHAEELAALEREKVQATDEVLMLQNQMAAIKTAYDAEVVKRQAMMLQIENYTPADDENIAALRKEIAQLQKELNELKTKYENEIAIRLLFEKEVSNLLEKIKTKYGE
ncbi:MAG: hypothetical protein EOM83_09210 [Clostridia bacterium]|nr:hypothetical protein [Clostridia bacterium]